MGGGSAGGRGGGYDHPQVAVRASNEEANMSWTWTHSTRVYVRRVCWRCWLSFIENLCNCSSGQTTQLICYRLNTFIYQNIYMICYYLFRKQTIIFSARVSNVSNVSIHRCSLRERRVTARSFSPHRVLGNIPKCETNQTKAVSTCYFDWSIHRWGKCSFVEIKKLRRVYVYS